MTIHKQQALDAFAAYTKDYDPANPMIALKISHTYRVATLCETIAAAEGLNPDLAWLCGLLHDIGRFEQVRRYGTFNDAASVSHAKLGVEVLYGGADRSGPRIRRFIKDDKYDGILCRAIALHSDYQLPNDLDPHVRDMCDVLRDADKIDIIKVNCLCPIEDIYGVTTEDMNSSKLSPAVVKTFYEHRTVPRDIRRYPADILVGHICFAWELVYPTSRQIVTEQGFLDQMLGRRFHDAETDATFQKMAAHMHRELLQTPKK